MSGTYSKTFVFIVVGTALTACGGSAAVLSSNPSDASEQPDGPGTDDGSGSSDTLTGSDSGDQDGGSTPDAIGDTAADGIVPGNGALGGPCTDDNQCAGALCLGGAFGGGYCSAPVAECDPGSAPCLGDAGVCKKTGGVDVDGSAIGEFCLETCQGPQDCRAGYDCCQGAEYIGQGVPSVCVPPSFCRD